VHRSLTGGRRRACSPLIALGLFAVPVAAQEATAPIRFAVAWSRGTPRGNLAEIADAPQGFTAQLALPVSRTARVGIRAEFSVLTFPERTLHTEDPETGTSLDATIRGTVGFTGAGPRLESRLGPVAIAVGAMGGFVRVITDATARTVTGDNSTSAALSLSDYAFAAKASLDLHLALLRGPSGTALGVVAGIDWLQSGQVEFPELRSFRVAAPGELTLERPTVSPSMMSVRAGVGVEF
jgi:hypothetical protein